MVVYDFGHKQPFFYLGLRKYRKLSGEQASFYSSLRSSHYNQ